MSSGFGLGRRVLLVTASIAVALLALEGGVRSLGHRNWKRFPVPRNEPVIHEEDPVLGWRNKPGQYEYPGYAPGAPTVHLTILDDGSRATSNHDPIGGRELLLIGCSFALGHALDDTESLGWQLQERMPLLLVRNHAVSGYGTYQALLRLEQLLRGRSDSPLVVYGFVEGHDLRNVADPGWLRTLAQFSRSGVIAVPYVMLGGGGALERHRPIRYPSWPLRNYSALVTLLQDRAATLAGSARASQRWAATESLVREMNSTVRDHGATLLVASLYADPQAMARIRGDWDQQGILTSGCELVEYPLPGSLRVPGEVHPNGVVNSRWADCITRSLAQLVESSDQVRRP